MLTEMAELAGAQRPLTIPTWVLRLAAPYLTRMLTMRVWLSNAKAKKELAWEPMFPSYHEGLRQTLQKAA
jgi:nucleoside-diphosphate-sugar epimerase